jgi:glutamate-5-semialdehyde dehydrogenase
VQALQADNAKDIERATGRRPGRADGRPPEAHAEDHRDAGQGCEQLAVMPDIIGEIIGMKQQPSGIRVGQMRVPLGVFGMIFESRPNVTIEAASLSIKSGNACILRGGSEAIESNKALARLVQQALAEAGLPADAVQLVQTTDREAVGQPDRHARVRRRDHPARRQGPDRAHQPRGQGAGDQAPGRQLPRLCRRPCDLAMAVKVADNAKTQKYSPCNASEGLLVARGVAARVPAAPSAPSSRPRASRCAAIRGQGHPGEVQAREPEGRHRAGLVRGIPRAHHQRQGGGGPGRGHRPHQPLFLAPHRRHRHARPRACAALPARGRIRPA